MTSLHEARYPLNNANLCIERYQEQRFQDGLLVCQKLGLCRNVKLVYFENGLIIENRSHQDLLYKL